MVTLLPHCRKDCPCCDEGASLIIERDQRIADLSRKLARLDQMLIESAAETGHLSKLYTTARVDALREVTKAACIFCMRDIPVERTGGTYRHPQERFGSGFPHDCRAEIVHRLIAQEQPTPAEQEEESP